MFRYQCFVLCTRTKGFFLSFPMSSHTSLCWSHMTCEGWMECCCVPAWLLRAQKCACCTAALQASASTALLPIPSGAGTEPLQCSSPPPPNLARATVQNTTGWWLTHSRHLFLIVLEDGKAKIKAEQVWCLVRPASWFTDGCRLCVSTRLKGWGRSLGSLIGY